MIALSLVCVEAESELLSAELWEHGATGIHEEPLPGGRTRLRAWFDRQEGLLDQFRDYAPVIAPEPPRDWEAESRQAWAPFAVGRRFWLAPEWDESPTPAGRLRLIVHPGMALGTGAHPATQLCLMALESFLTPSDGVLDVGTGSGILLSAAAALGARTPAGCDIDADAIRVAQTNLQCDGVAARLFQGSVRAVGEGLIDTLVANLNATTHEMLAADYARVARRLVILSGYPRRHGARTESALLQRGWHTHHILTLEDWTCHIFTPGADS